MIWILIFVVGTSHSSQAGMASSAIEFSSKAACLAAAEGIKKQVQDKRDYSLYIACSAKG